MTRTLRLVIATPSAVLVDRADVRSMRAEDSSGSFGVLPGHADLLTVLPPSVVRWRCWDEPWRFCAVRGGILTVAGGARVAIACRQGTTGDTLARLEDDVRAMRAAEADAGARARVEQTRLHAQVVRELMRLLRPERNGPSGVPAPSGSDAP